MEQGAIQPLRLEAMTLRGLGSYLHGGRLEIRPLTVLCGTNGSGKSTWFRMIELLRQSLEDGRLPFAFSDDLGCGEGDFHDYTNAFVKWEPDRHALLASPERDREFGRLGTIGLHIVADLDFDLDDAAEPSPLPDLSEIGFDQDSVAQSFLWAGQCRRGTRIRLRMNDATCDIAGLVKVPRRAELVIDEDFVITFEEVSESSRFDAPDTRAASSEAIPGRPWPEFSRFEAACTRAFWPGCESQDLTELAVAEFDLSDGVIPTNVRGPDGAEGFDLLEQFCETAVVRIRQLLEVILRGTFWLRAIRPVQTRAYVDPEDLNDDSIIGRRFVGQGGQYTHALSRRFAYNVMRRVADSDGGRIDYRYPFVGGAVLDVLRTSESLQARPLARRIWEGVSMKEKEKIERLDPLATKEAVTWATQILNESLKRSDLYHPSFAEYLDEEAKRLLDHGLERLDDRDIERFNRMLIDAAFADLVDPHPGFVFDTYYAGWLKNLLGMLTRRHGRNDTAAFYWTDPENPPIGYLERFRPDDDRARAFASEDDLRNLNLYTSPLFGETGLEAAPVHMSSGFHQIAPMVVQAGLMRANEVLCIENPEVHLHPKLQLEVTEFLVRQARIGKTILVETHSDLVIRRVMRAILEEDIKQEAVRIHFADVDLDSASYKELGYASSRIQAIEIGERGQIQNWPAGFMDDDIRESRRLLDVMYGIPGDAGDEEEAVP